MDNQTAYIDELLKAQAEANATIASAQKERQLKLKQAREAAQSQIKRYRDQKQSDFMKMKERKQDKDYEKALEKETDQQIERIKEDYNRNKDEVITMLVEKVLEVDLTIPKSVKEKFIKKE